MIPTVAPYLVPPLLPLIRAGGGRLSIREAVTDTLLIELRQGEIDAAVLALPAGVPGLIEEPLFEDRFLLARPPRALAPRMARPERPEQIDPDILLLLDEGHCLSDQALGACKLRRDGARIRLGAASLATLTRLVASGCTRLKCEARLPKPSTPRKMTSTSGSPSIRAAASAKVSGASRSSSSRCAMS